MFEGDKWARQSAIVVLIHTAALSIFEVSGIGLLRSHGLALVAIGLIIVGIHRSTGNQIFKGEKWKEEAQVNVAILAILAFFLGPYGFPITIGVIHAAVWFIRKKTGGDKAFLTPIDEGKIGSPF